MWKRKKNTWAFTSVERNQMNFENAKDLLWEHLKADSSVVLVTGKWGVGKSFLVRKYLSEIEIPHLRVSAFNTTSSSEFRTKLGISQLLGNRGEQISSILSLASKVISKIPKLKFVADVSGDKISDFAYHTIESKVIWIDDLERCPDNKAINSMLGEVLDLVELKKCKAIICCNTEKSTELWESFEKCCTSHLEFERDLNEIFTIGLGSKEYFEICKPILADLKISNIRILFRLSRILDVVLKPHFARIRAEVQEQIIRTAALACFFKYSGTYKNALKLMREHNETSPTTDNNGDEAFHSELFRLGYRNTDQLDQMIIEYVDKGTIDKFKLRNIAIESDKQAAKSAAKSGYLALKYELENRLDFSKQEIFERIRDFITQHASSFDVYQWNDLLRMIKLINDARIESEFLDHIPVKFFTSFRSMGDLSSSIVSYRFYDEIISRIHFAAPETSEEVMAIMCEKLKNDDMWTSEEVDFIISADAEAFVRHFCGRGKEVGGQVLFKMVKIANSDLGVRELNVAKKVFEISDRLKNEGKGSFSLSLIDLMMERLRHLQTNE